jgi:two-component system chemotaxis sensor kinase CheA
LKDYDRSLLEIFSAEQAEHIARIRALTDSLAAMPVEARAGAFEEILRCAHTLKGASRAVGLEPTEQIAHRLESLFGQAQAAGAALGEQPAVEVHRALDAMEDVLAAAIAGRPEPDSAAAVAPTQPAAGAEFLRVNAANVDGLIRASSQMMTSVSAESVAQQHAEQLAQRTSQTLTEYLRLQRACRPYLRLHQDEEEAAPLQECLEYVERELRVLAGEARSSAVSQQHRAWELRRRVTDLHQGAVKVRMIPAESVFGAFGAMVRQIAQDEGKQLEFRAEGLEAEADRLVLQALKDPVMHLLRNAVSHGIETPAARLAAGKAAVGNVRLQMDARGDTLYVVVEDDGPGLNLARVRDRAVALGLLTEEEAAAKNRVELTKLIFRPGISTAATITNISGRGMGLSIVEQTVDRLQGKVEVDGGRYGGLQVTISVAFSISTQQMLLVEAGGSVFGLPARFAQQLVRVQLSGLQTMEGREILAVEGKPIPLAYLSDLLGLPAKPAADAEDREPWVFIAALTHDDQTIGVIVDRLVDEREAVVKELGLSSRMAGITAGGIPLEDGRVAIVLNPAAVFERFRETARRPAPRKVYKQSAKSTQRILVVDDSLTTRSLEKSILEAHGFDVSIAVDGMEALEKLSAHTFNLVISDVTMPRMDGLQLLEQMKKQNSTARIPVIMVTSLESPEDRQRGMSLGADAYIVKRKFDQEELLRTVRQIL